MTIATAGFVTGDGRLPFGWWRLELSSLRRSAEAPPSSQCLRLALQEC